MEQKHGPPLHNSQGIWVHLISGVCILHYTFPGRPTFLMRRSADVLTRHHSHTSSAPPASSSLGTLHMPIHPQTKAEPLGPVWTLCQGTGTTNWATCLHSVTQICCMYCLCCSWIWLWTASSTCSSNKSTASVPSFSESITRKATQ